MGSVVNRLIIAPQKLDFDRSNPNYGVRLWLTQKQHEDEDAMNTKFNIIEIPKCLAVAVHLDIARQDIAQEMDRAIKEIFMALAQQQRSPIGPLFAHHHSLSDTRFDMEVGFPIAAVITESGRVRTIELDSITAAQTTHKGPYEGLYAAWSEFGNAVRASCARSGSAAPSTLFREIYRLGPDALEDSAEWETDLVIPLPAS